ncbi:hypothetical protein P8452_57448 [Trifolium repens]|nr:hypothetical protein P8452_57448 [Trifolium repens]
MIEQLKKLLNNIEETLEEGSEPYGNEFNPSTVVRFLTKSIKSKFDWFCPTWGDTTKEMQKLWFIEFKKYCTWERKYDARIRQIFEIKGEARFRGSSIHTGGSISMGEHARWMKATTVVEPTMEEVFAKCHTKKDESWVDSRAEEAYNSS